eukprot:TRINITY_DN3612_c0_g2_i2.p1 TRINITY_DN3612_c0_g2~~TRINITY_DN3612_c0_g2_i2.p1  ORF type:complete len:847 (+),score=154.74 TRINITY_DN3612_c0_g2_i2:61-2541(+)
MCIRDRGKGFGLAFASRADKVRQMSHLGQATGQLLAPSASHGLIYRDFENATFFGESSQPSLHVKGVIFWNDGDAYCGSLIDNHAHGSGELFLASGGRFLGQFSQGKATDFGQYFALNGDFFYGFWSEGLPHGQGISYNKSSDTWKHSRFVQGEERRMIALGKGVPTSEEIDAVMLDSGDDLQSTPSISHIEGKSRMSDTPTEFEYSSVQNDNGDRSLGFWRSSKLNGIGVEWSSKGLVTVGNFVNGVLDGVARVHFPNGDIFFGTFSNGIYHGSGVYYSGNSQKWIYAVFDHNEILHILERGVGFPPPSYWAFHANEPSVKVEKPQVEIGSVSTSSIGMSSKTLTAAPTPVAKFHRLCSSESFGRIEEKGDFSHSQALFALSLKEKGALQYPPPLFEKQPSATGSPLGQSEVSSRPMTNTSKSSAESKKDAKRSFLDFLDGSPSASSTKTPLHGSPANNTKNGRKLESSTLRQSAKLSQVKTSKPPPKIASTKPISRGRDGQREDYIDFQSLMSNFSSVERERAPDRRVGSQSRDRKLKPAPRIEALKNPKCVEIDLGPSKGVKLASPARNPSKTKLSQSMQAVSPVHKSNLKASSRLVKINLTDRKPAEQDLFEIESICKLSVRREPIPEVKITESNLTSNASMGKAKSPKSDRKVSFTAAATLKVSRLSESEVFVKSTTSSHTTKGVKEHNGLLSSSITPTQSAIPFFSPQQSPLTKLSKSTVHLVPVSQSPARTQQPLQLQPQISPLLSASKSFSNLAMTHSGTCIHGPGHRCFHITRFFVHTDGSLCRSAGRCGLSSHTTQDIFRPCSPNVTNQYPSRLYL